MNQNTYIYQGKVILYIVEGAIKLKTTLFWSCLDSRGSVATSDYCIFISSKSEIMY